MNFPSFVKIAVLKVKHFMVLNETSENNISITGGIEGAMVQILSDILNFKYMLITPKDSEWGALKQDGNWTGIIGMVNRSEVDIGISLLTITEERNNAVCFIPYATEATAILMNIPNAVPNSYFYTDPLERQVWIACFLVLLIFSLFYCLLMPNSSYVVVFLTNLGYFLKQTSKTRSRTLTTYFFIGSWNIFTCIMTLSYTAVLLSFMTVPQSAKGVETIKDLAEAVSEARYKCYSAKGSANSEFFLNSADASLQYLGRMIQENGWFYNEENQLENDMAFIGPRSWFELERNSDITNRRFIFKEYIAIWNGGIAVDKSFCCARKLETVLSRMKSAGIFVKLFDEEVHRGKLSKYKSYVPEMREATITIGHIYGTFILLLGGYVISSLVLIGEIISSWGRGIKSNDVAQ